MRTRELSVPSGAPALAGAALARGLLWCPRWWRPRQSTALLGATGRNSGFWAYAAALILYFSVLRAFTAASTKVLAFALLAAGGFTAVYGLLQKLGIDAIAWNNPFNPIIATLGNPDFASAYVGIAVPVAVWAACWTGWPVAMRAASGALAVLCLVIGALSSAVQGPIAAAAGLAVVALALTLDLSKRRRRAGLLGLGALSGAGAAVLLGWRRRSSGPRRPFFTGISYDARTWYWGAALKMWRRSPLTGIGMDSYGLYWRRDRPLANPRTVGGDAYSDSAHSVPLQHLAQGGLLLAAAYVFFLVVVSVALVRGFARLRGQERLLLAGLGGAWVAYQVQSLVSIDQVPLLVLNFTLGAGVIVASGSARLKVIKLPGALREVDQTRGRKVKAPRARPLGGVDIALLSVIGLGLVVASWLSLSPLRANLAAHRGDIALSAGDGTNAILHFQQAVALEPGFGPYRTRIGQTYNLGSLPDQARTAFIAAFRVDKAEIAAGRTAGRLAESAGDYKQAGDLFAEALTLDPSNSATILDWATFQLRHGSAADAQKRLERAVVDLPGEAGLWASLGDARGVFKDVEGARAAYERALQIKPDEPTATAGLQKLG